MGWAEIGNRRSVVSPDGPAAAPPQSGRRSRQHLRQSRGTAGRGSESLGAGAPALHPGGCCVVPQPSEHPPPLPPEVSVPAFPPPYPPPRVTASPAHRWPGPGRLPLPGLSAVLCTGLRGRSGLMRVRAGGLSLVLRVGSSPQGHQGQRGDRGDPGQGPALGLLAAQGTTQGPQAPGPLHSHRGPSWGDGGLGETHPAGCGPSGPDRELEEKL